MDYGKLFTALKKRFADVVFELKFAHTILAHTFI